MNSRPHIFGGLVNKKLVCHAGNKIPYNFFGIVALEIAVVFSFQKPLENDRLATILTQVVQIAIKKELEQGFYLF